MTKPGRPGFDDAMRRSVRQAFFIGQVLTPKIE